MPQPAPARAIKHQGGRVPASEEEADREAKAGEKPRRAEKKKRKAAVAAGR